MQYIRVGMDPYPLVGWKKIQMCENGAVAFEGPHGEVYEDLQQVYEHEVAAKALQTGVSENRLALSFLQKFLKECCSEQRQEEEENARVVVTTSTLEDWALHERVSRGLAMRDLTGCLDDSVVMKHR